MDIVINLVLLLGAFVMMEGVANVTHRHVMHGWLWCLHESHHSPREGAFELNDFFAMFFATPSIIFIYLGVNVWSPLLWVGLGMTAYGFAYFAFHDGIVHRRLPVRYRGRNPYMKRIIQAHYVHHATTSKEGAVSFGFLYSRPVAELDAERRRLAAESSLRAPA